MVFTQNWGLTQQKRGVIRKWWHPAFFAFIWISSFSVALLAWRSVYASLRCGNRCFRNGQRKQIIRTHLLSETSSDYIGLVPEVGLEPTRYRYQRILSPSRLPVPSFRRRQEGGVSTEQNCSTSGRPLQGKTVAAGGGNSRSALSDHIFFLTRRGRHAIIS